MSQTSSSFKVKSSSTGNGRFQCSRDSERHVNKKFGSITGFSSDRFKTPHISESRLSHEASRSCKSGCVLSCCNSCSFCIYHRASTKERSKSRTSVEKNKACEQCFLCRSMSFCPKCSRCPHCCARWSCRRPSSKVLASLAKVRRKPSSSFHSKGGLQPAIQIKTSSHQGSNHSEQLCQSGKKPFPQRGTDLSPRKVGSGASPGPVFSRFLQPAVFSTQTGKQVEAYFRSESVEQVPQNRHIQDGNSGNHPDLATERGVGDLAGFQRRILSHPYSPPVEEVHEILSQQKSVPIHCPSLRVGHGSSRVHQDSQGGQTYGSEQGYKNPPVPRRLVTESPFEGDWSPSHPGSFVALPRTGLASQPQKVGTESSTGLYLRRLPVRPVDGSGFTNSRKMGKLASETTVFKDPGQLHGKAVHVLDRTLDSHRETGQVRSSPHASHSVAPKKTLAGARGPRESHSATFLSATSPRLVVRRGKCIKGPTLASIKSRPSTVYRRIKRRLGRSLRGLYGKRRLVRSRKPASYQLLGTQGSFSGPQEFRTSLPEPDCLGGDRQYNCGRLYQQTRGYEIRLSLCPSLETPFLVPSQRNSSESQAHSGSTECHSRQALPTQSGDPDRVVPVPTGVQSLVFQLGPAADRSFCHQIQSQASQVCLSSSGFDSLGGGCSQPYMGQPERVRLSPSLPAHSGHIQTGESRFSQDDLNRSGLAQHALVLGSDQSIKSNSLQSSLREESVDSTVQRPSPQELESSESACLAPRASSIRRQGFSEEVAARIEAPQRSSTRAVYKSKWAIFVKWCESSQVDFRAPSLKQVADFLLYLFKERQLQPSTIEGYRTAIADMLGNDPVHFGKDESLTRLLDSFHRDKPKGRRGVPAWNLSLVLHQLTKAPFEPMRKASLKHLTFKTVFLLALGSGKRRSEIHAWLYRNIRHQENWSQVSLYPSPSFLSKNQLARDGPSAVAPVVIPALAPSLDRSLKEDKSLCPVRALRYYLDRTKDLRSGKDLVFVSFRKSFQKDIVPATVSSWIKQTVLLCYQLSDHEAQNIHQVRAHDVRAFAASKAFQGGVSLDQILSACHWKAHNTFTQFYLKDLAWADSELYHLGPVVAAQQIHEHQ